MHLCYHIILHQKTFQFLAAQRCWQWPQLQILPFGQLHPRGAHGQDGRQAVLWNPKTDVVLIRLQDQQSLKREIQPTDTNRYQLCGWRFPKSNGGNMG